MVLKPCEIIYVKKANGWKWRTVTASGTTAQTSKETFELFYECVSAARTCGYNPPIKCR